MHCGMQKSGACGKENREKKKRRKVMRGDGVVEVEVVVALEVAAAQQAGKQWTNESAAEGGLPTQVACARRQRTRRPHGAAEVSRLSSEFIVLVTYHTSLLYTTASYSSILQNRWRINPQNVP